MCVSLAHITRQRKDTRGRKEEHQSPLSKCFRLSKTLFRSSLLSLSLSERVARLSPGHACSTTGAALSSRAPHVYDASDHRSASRPRFPVLSGSPECRSRLNPLKGPARRPTLPVAVVLCDGPSYHRRAGILHWSPDLEVETWIIPNFSF